MCGIAGILNWDKKPVSSVTLQNMIDSIAHRGPDGEGVFANQHIGLGHRRLAILDLTPAGHQPMMSLDKNIILTYNGELYNFQELRIELESAGHQFHTRTDTEVILNAYKQWGRDCLNKFNGMFAFAIWDRSKQSLFLARDRYGIKPLYYYSDKNLFSFGSEIKAILAHPEVSAGIDKEALVEYFTYQNFFTDRTIVADVKMLPAGHFMEISLSKPHTVDPVQYWDFCFEEPENPQPEKDYIDQLDHLFEQAVQRQLVSDVEVGSYLSGGMDSGSITAIAAKNLDNLKTFTCGFDLHSASGLELAFDERKTAEYMSYVFSTEHYEMVLKAGDMERYLDRLTHHLEEPRVGQSYPNFCIAQLASKFVKVVLGGTGGDELFAGYPWRYCQALDNENFDDYIGKYYRYWQRLIPSDKLSSILSPIWNEVKDISTEKIFRNIYPKNASQLTRPEDYLNHSLYMEAKTFLHGLLVVDDKLAMAHGLEKRVPFLDNDLVDFAMKLPASLKLKDMKKAQNSQNFKKSSDGKMVLRKAMQRHIPSDICKAVKQGFSAPDASWFKGESINFVKETLFSSYAPVYEYLDKTAVQNTVSEHLEGKANHRLFIWALLSVNCFLKEFKLASGA